MYLLTEAVLSRVIDDIWAIRSPMYLHLCMSTVKTHPFQHQGDRKIDEFERQLCNNFSGLFSDEVGASLTSVHLEIEIYQICN